MAEPAQPPAGTPGERIYESEMVVAVFRTAFILLVMFSPGVIKGLGRYSLALQLSVLLAALYNVALLFTYWRGLGFRGQRYFTVTVDLLFITAWVLLTGERGTTLFPLYYALVVIAGLWFSVAGTLAVATASAFLYIGAIVLMGLLPAESPALTQAEMLSEAFSYQIPYLFLVAVIVAYMVDARNRERESWHQTRLLLTQYQERRRMMQQFYDELAPRALGNVPGLGVGLRFRPALRMGAGDYYDLLEIAPGRYGVAVADLAGKFAPGMSKLPALKYALRAAARVYSDPAEVVKSVNSLLYEELQPDMFISLWYGVYDTGDGTLRYANAGHNPPLLARRANRQAEELGEAGLVVGVNPEGDYQSAETVLSPGDVLVLYTDGVVGNVNAEGEEFDLERLKALAIAATALDLRADEIAERIFAQANQFARGGTHRDDMTVLVLRRPVGPRPH